MTEAEVKVKEIKEIITPEMLSIPGVTGLGVVRASAPFLRVYVESMAPAIINRIPEKIGGVDVELFATGRIKMLPLLEMVPLELSRVDKWRPAPGGVSIGHYCYDDKTQVLTSIGLRYFSELSYEHEIATLNKSGELEYCKPTNIFHYNYNGKMIQFGGKKSNYDILVSPNHRMYVNISKRKPMFHFVEASTLLDAKYAEFKRDAVWNCLSISSFSVPLPSRLNEKFIIYSDAMALRQKGYGWRNATRRLGSKWRTHIQNWYRGSNPKNAFRLIGNTPINIWLSFLGWYLSEGSVSRKGYRVRLSQSRVHKVYREEIIKNIKDMGFTPTISRNQNHITFCSAQLVEWLIKECGMYSHERKVPKIFKQLPSDQLMYLLDSLFKGDGSFVRGCYKKSYNKKWHGCYYTYGTTSEQLAYDVCELLLKCGLSFTIHLHPRRDLKSKPFWKIRVVNKYLTPRMCTKPKSVHYEGKIHCVEVPNHVILVVRNGKPIWCGNSITAGTLGSRVFDIDSGEKLILSNNHVLANCDAIKSERAHVGDSILQPGPIDGGPSGTFAELLRWVRYDEVGFNKVDCALARPVNPDDVADDILEIGVITEMDSVYVGDKVRKSGRTSGLTAGIVADINATITVEDTFGGILTFEDQIIVTPPILSPGDSGSLVVSAGNKAVGLGFAGTFTVSVANKISNVAEALNIHFGGGRPPPPPKPAGPGTFWGFVSSLPLMAGMVGVGWLGSEWKGGKR